MSDHKTSFGHYMQLEDIDFEQHGESHNSLFVARVKKTSDTDIYQALNEKEKNNMAPGITGSRQGHFA